MSKKVLIAGESWFSYTTHIKGFDSFYTSVYEEGVEYLRNAIIKAGYEVTFMPNHIAAESFPYTMEELKQFDCVILSDIGANTLLLPAATFSKSISKPNRCQLIKDYVEEGGALIMIGGYMTFSGVDAKGRWGWTPVQDVLPVRVLEIDDRCEHPEGIVPKIEKEHAVLQDVPVEWPHFLGYNKTELIDGAELVASIAGDPFVAVGNYGKGKSAVFTSDCAPHWGPPEFVNWAGYDLLWKSMLNYLVK